MSEAKKRDVKNEILDLVERGLSISNKGVKEERS